MNVNTLKMGLILWVSVVLAASFQSLCAPEPLCQVKVPFLLGVSVYYGMRHRLGVALVAACVCGLWDDGLSNLPRVASLFLFPAITLFCWGVLKRQLSEHWVSCCVATAVGGVFLQVSQAVALSLDGGFEQPPLYFLLVRFLVAGFVSAVGGGVAAIWGRYWDVACGIAGVSHEVDPYPWRTN